MKGALQSELIKLKYSGLLWLSTLGTLITNVMMALLAILLPTISINGLSYEIDVTKSWQNWIEFHYQGITPMLLPMYLVILCALSILMENRSNTWKNLYTLPIRKSTIYLSKLLVVLILFAGSHLMFVLVLVFIPFITGMDLTSNPFPSYFIFQLYAGTIVSSMGILGLVYLSSYYVKSFVFPLAVGIIGFVLAQLMMDYGYSAQWFPFAQPFLTTATILEMSYFPWMVSFYSLLFFIIITFLGSFYSRYRKTRA